MNHDDATLLDIKEAVLKIFLFTEGMSEAVFYEDEKTQSAVMHQFLILGEAVKRLSESIRTEHPEIPWKRIAGLRDRLIHDYNEVDIERVWRIIKKELPDLRKKIMPLLPERSEPA